MKRLWIITSCLAGVVFNCPAYSMALGDIDLRSSLNEPLNAAIEVFGTDEVTREDVKFSVATEEAFTAAGIERPDLLKQIRFTWVPGKPGHYFLKLTTQEPIREPFLDFLLEANWPNGHLMREFTLLLDPPTFADTAPTVQAVQPVVIAPAKVKIQKQAAQKIKPDTQYGPTQAGDSLWKIATQAATGTELTPQQYMVAIYQENPEAFKNIHSLKRHATLHIPSIERAGLVAKEEAMTQIHGSNIETAATQAPPAEVVPTPITTAKEQELTTDDLLADLSPEDTNSATTLAPAAEQKSNDTHRLQILASDVAQVTPTNTANQSTDQASTVADLRQELAVTNEALDTAKRANEEMNTRMSQLEQQLNSMRELIILKEKIQNSPETIAQNLTQKSKAPTLAKPMLKKIKAPAEIVPVNSKTNHTFTWGFMTLLLLGLSFAGFAWHRGLFQRHEDLESEDESNDEHNLDDVQVGDHCTLYPVGINDTGAYSVVEAKPTSIGQDPLEEADILIAFGRFADAAQVLLNAQNLEPENQVLRTKLLQVYAKLGEQKSFDEQYAQIPAHYWYANPDVATTIYDLAHNSWPAVYPQLTQEQVPVEELAKLIKPTQNIEPQTSVKINPVESLFEMPALKQTDTGAIVYEPPEKVQENPAPSTNTETVDASPNFDNAIEWTSQDLEKITPVTDTLGQNISTTTTSAADDEIATKLELARAYIEIGDSEGARDILEEVIGMGTDQQQEDAKALLKSL